MGVLLEVGVLIEGMVFSFDFLVFLASPNNTPRRYKSGNTVDIGEICGTASICMEICIYQFFC